MNKDQKVTLFRATLKLVLVFVILTVLQWMGWNLMVVKELGVGNVIETERMWIFGLPSLALFYFLRLLSPAWFILLKLSDFLIYSLLILSWIGLISWI